MVKINKFIYKQLQPYESFLRSAYYGSYIMNLSTTKFLEIIEIARKGGWNGSANPTCNSCKIKVLKDIGKYYFEYQKSLTVKKENKRKKIEEPIEEIEKGDN